MSSSLFSSLSPEGSGSGSDTSLLMKQVEAAAAAVAANLYPNHPLPSSQADGSLSLGFDEFQSAAYSNQWLSQTSRAGATSEALTTSRSGAWDDSVSQHDEPSSIFNNNGINGTLGSSNGYQGLMLPLHESPFDEAEELLAFQTTRTSSRTSVPAVEPHVPALHSLLQPTANRSRFGGRFDPLPVTALVSSEVTFPAGTVGAEFPSIANSVLAQLDARQIALKKLHTLALNQIQRLEAEEAVLKRRLSRLPPPPLAMDPSQSRHRYHQPHQQQQQQIPRLSRVQQRLQKQMEQREVEREQEVLRLYHLQQQQKQDVVESSSLPAADTSTTTTTTTSSSSSSFSSPPPPLTTSRPSFSITSASYTAKASPST
eukprot:TRINITY_DN4745_c1_g1_i1.p1 TRINITY_DN4745_c1_g1~~TRINITY_DN4745_c1_g1_i1.p1  ORF type:complete len:371 (-),score=69.87 TRINITY_DN4745_c1_g1_i1:26-1138(-)